MKLTLVILFLSLPVFAQYPSSQSKPDAYLLGVDSGEVFVPNGKLIHNTDFRRCAESSEPEVARPPWTLSYSMDDIEYHALLTRLLSDWQDYRDSCWADSTLHEWWGPAIREVGGTLYSYGNFRHEEWVHRDPTLPGFMDFLKKRMGK